MSHPMIPTICELKSWTTQFSNTEEVNFIKRFYKIIDSKLLNV
jgi:hypothetical protein